RSQRADRRGDRAARRPDSPARLHGAQRTLADFAKQVETSGESFNIRNFFDRLNAIDSIPISLARWEMTGLDDEIRTLTQP
ncbi:MAG: hypothetical protein ACE5F8_01505, partial [Woeseiaceae bacterium]